jgi:hypothetical protein
MKKNRRAGPYNKSLAVFFLEKVPTILHFFSHPSCFYASVCRVERETLWKGTGDDPILSYCLSSRMHGTDRF